MFNYFIYNGPCGAVPYMRRTSTNESPLAPSAAIWKKPAPDTRYEVSDRCIADDPRAPLPMNRCQRYIQQASRSRGSLWRWAMGMLLGGAMVGYGLSRLDPPGSAEIGERVAVSIMGNVPDFDRLGPLVRPVGAVAALAEELRNPGVEFVHVLEFMPTLAGWTDVSEDGTVQTMLETRFGRERTQLAVDLLSACRDGGDEAEARLRAAVEAAEPVRWAAYARGLLEVHRHNYRPAYDCFRQEGENPEAGEARAAAVGALTYLEDWDELQHLQSEPGYADLFGPWLSLQLAIHLEDWRAIVRWVPVSQFSHLDPAIVALTLVTGLAWGFFLVHLGEFSGAPRGHGMLCLCALLAGIVSTTPTIYAVIWQDDFLHFSGEGDLMRSLLYYIGGVGVREEICKLLLFVPFLPFLIKRDDELEALIVASFVGLGFAIEENGNYFLSTQGAAAAGRFLTANFFHVALTGVNGLALYRACTRGMAGWNEFLSVLGITIIAHGLYDGLLGLPDPAMGTYLAMAVFILVSRFYFNRAHELRDNTRMNISLTGSFVAGVSLVASAMLIFQMARLGAGPGITMVVPELIGSGVLLIMFFREFDEPLAE